MSENSKLNYRDLLKKTAVTYEQVVERVREEQTRTQVDRFRIGEDGDYAVRILPLAPYVTASGEIDETKKLRPSFEYPLQQMFIDIKGEAKKKGGKPTKITVPIVRATQEGVGKSVDLIDTYKKLVKELYPEDKDLIEKMNQGNYQNSAGLKWASYRVMYVFDADAKKRTPLLWQCSYPQYADICDRQIKLWDKLKKKDENAEDPIASFGTSYILEVTRKTEKGKTSYSFNIDTTSDDELDDNDLNALFSMPRIPDVIYRYGRYHFEATIEFLKQYDEEHDLDIMKEEAMQNAIDALKGELDPNDQGHFDMTSAGKDGEGKGKVTFEQLNERYNSLIDRDLADDSEEGIDLREDIRAFCEDNGLNVVMKHSMSTAEILDAVEDAIDALPAAVEKKAENEEPKKEEKKDDEPKDEPEKTSRRRRGADDDDKEPEKKDEKSSDEDEDRPSSRRRGARPTRDDDEGDKEPEKKEEEKQSDEDESPRRERRRRRTEE